MAEIHCMVPQERTQNGGTASTKEWNGSCPRVVLSNKKMYGYTTLVLCSE